MKTKANVLIIVLLVALSACNNRKPSVEPVQELVKNETDLVEHGEYLVNIVGCADCHTPKKMTEQGPVPDMNRYMMGFDSSGALPPIPENVPMGPWVLFGGELTVVIGPWGTSYAGNITPHETGIGTWSLERFKKAMQEGKYKGMDNTRPLMPPMPVEAYKHMTDADVEAIFTYLRSIKPIENIVPGYEPPTPLP